MRDFVLADKFKLELHWDTVSYDQPGICRIHGAYFTGPVIKIAQKINDNDHLSLDFYSQYITLVKSIFVAKFSWGKVTYSDDGDTAFLQDAFLVHEAELNNVPVLKDNDYFVIDTSNHTTDVHQYHLLYKTYLINCDNSFYRFGK